MGLAVGRIVGEDEQNVPVGEFLGTLEGAASSSSRPWRSIPSSPKTVSQPIISGTGGSIRPLSGSNLLVAKSNIPYPSHKVRLNVCRGESESWKPTTWSITVSETGSRGASSASQ